VEKATTPNGTPLERASDGLSITDAARMLGVHHQTIRNWINAGQLPVTRFGPPGVRKRARARIHPDDLERMRG
jgi:excisionase family DNA binding protein